MAIWYLNMLQESEKGMKLFDNKIHDYWGKDRKAEVYLLDNGGYGCRYYENKVWKHDITFEGKSEAYAESAAENYVLHINDIT